MAEIAVKFMDMALLVLQYSVDEEMKKKRYRDMLLDDIRELVSMSSYKTLDDMIAKAQEREIELQLREIEKVPGWFCCTRQLVIT